MRLAADKKGQLVSQSIAEQADPYSNLGDRRMLPASYDLDF
jgi:hypothetical protein